MSFTKKIYLILLIISVVILAAQSAQLIEKDKRVERELTIIDTEEYIYPTEAWQNASLFEVFSTPITYSFDKEELLKMIENPELNEFRFILGVKKNKLQIACTGITNLKRPINQFSIGKQNIYSLTLPKNKLPTYSIKNELDKKTVKHLLNPNEAINYIKNWQKAIHNFTTLESKISLDGRRIEHYTISKEAILALLNQKNVTSIELFWGLNANQKMTTVFLGKTKEGKILLPNSYNIALDFSHGGIVSPDCGGCAQRCEDPWWMCCVAQPPCPDDNDE